MASGRRTHAAKSRARARNGARGGTLLGVFVGIVLGLGIAAAVAYYLGRSGLTTATVAPGAAKEATHAAKADVAVAPSAPEKPRFDFYKILPGGEEPRTAPDRRSVDRTGTSAPDKGTAVPAKPVDRLWLQAGAFASESDAENLKARLALSGWEAAVQPAPQPDKSIRYRVRMGPYDNTDELNRIKSELGKGGFDVAVIRNP